MVPWQRQQRQTKKTFSGAHHKRCRAGLSKQWTETQSEAVPAASRHPVSPPGAPVKGRQGRIHRGGEGWDGCRWQVACSPSKVRQAHCSAMPTATTPQHHTGQTPTIVKRPAISNFLIFLAALFFCPLAAGQQRQQTKGQMSWGSPDKDSSKRGLGVFRGRNSCTERSSQKETH